MKYICIIILFSFYNVKAQDLFSRQEIKNIIKPHVDSSWLEGVDNLSIVFSKQYSEFRKVALISTFNLGGLNTKEKDLDKEEFPFFLIDEKKCIHFEETESINNFNYLTEINTKYNSFIVFFHYSTIGGFLKYYILDLDNYKWYETDNIYENKRIDFLSIDFKNRIYKYYFGNAEIAKDGDLIPL